MSQTGGYSAASTERDFGEKFCLRKEIIRLSKNAGLKNYQLYLMRFFQCEGFKDFEDFEDLLDRRIVGVVLRRSLLGKAETLLRSCIANRQMTKRHPRNNSCCL